MDEKTNPQYLIFNSKPVGDAVNPHVYRVAPQREPDFAKINQFIKESGEQFSVKKSES